MEKFREDVVGRIATAVYGIFPVDAIDVRNTIETLKNDSFARHLPTSSVLCITVNAYKFFLKERLSKKFVKNKIQTKQDNKL